MAQIVRTAEPSIQRQPDRLFATFELSEEPKRAWIAHFRERADFSIFRYVQSAIVRGKEIRGVRDPYGNPLSRDEMSRENGCYQSTPH